VEEFAARFLDERGYLLHTPRWGTLDGPDDAIETYWNWTLLHALGGSDTVLELFKKGQEGYWRQYSEIRTKLTTLAANGSYSKEFITQADWFHTGEGMRAFLRSIWTGSQGPMLRKATTYRLGGQPRPRHVSLTAQPGRAGQNAPGKAPKSYTPTGWPRSTCGPWIARTWSVFPSPRPSRMQARCGRPGRRIRCRRVPSPSPWNEPRSQP